MLQDYKVFCFHALVTLNSQHRRTHSRHMSRYIRPGGGARWIAREPVILSPLPYLTLETKIVVRIPAHALLVGLRNLISGILAETSTFFPRTHASHPPHRGPSNTYLHLFGPTSQASCMSPPHELRFKQHVHAPVCFECLVPSNTTRSSRATTRAIVLY